VSGVFLLGYAACRFAAEFAREPDAFLGTLGLGLTMGQWLCVPMAAAGGLLLWRARRLPPTAAPA
jgi:phosphatidylglycerol:prolipoprotein diacylglycerol transferase